MHEHERWHLQRDRCVPPTHSHPNPRKERGRKCREAKTYGKVSLLWHFVLSVNRNRGLKFCCALCPFTSNCSLAQEGLVPSGWITVKCVGLVGTLWVCFCGRTQHHIVPVYQLLKLALSLSFTLSLDRIRGKNKN